MVGHVFESRGHDVIYVNEALPAAADDDLVDQFARSDKRIIEGHDQRFLKRIQQQIYQFPDSVGSGYGRIMLIGREGNQPDRIRSALPFIELCHTWAHENERRFLIVVGDHFIRYDDREVRRIPPSSAQRIVPVGSPDGFGSKDEDPAPES